MFFGKKKLINEIEQLKLENSTLHTRDLLSRGMSSGSSSGERDLYSVYRYIEKPQFRDLYKHARRSGIANRIAFGMPKSCWADGFSFTSDVELEKPILEETEHFFKKSLNYLERADGLGRIGRFSALYVGVPDGLDPIEPLGSVMGDALESIFLRPFAYDGIEIAAYEEDVNSERFGLPLLYQMWVRARGDTEKTIVRTKFVAHWSRVIHIAEHKLDSDIEGIPALEPIINRIVDIEKATGGASEAYFRGARPKVAFEVDPEFSGILLSNETAKDKFDDAAKKFTDDWQDQIIAVGSKVTTHSPTLSSPIDTIKAALWDISAQTRYPIRLLTGEGSGQLAGSEDKLAYNVLVQDRRETFCSAVVARLLEILGECGAITLPDEYFIKWNKQDATTELEEAQIGQIKAAALTAVGGVINGLNGEAFDLRSTLDAVGLEDIEINDIEFNDPNDFGDVDGEDTDQETEDTESASVQDSETDTE